MLREIAEGLSVRSHFWLVSMFAEGTTWTTKRSEFVSRKGQECFTSLYRPDLLWGLPNLLSNGYRGPFHDGKVARGVKLTPLTGALTP
jgi:hypothetical protein